MNRTLFRVLATALVFGALGISGCATGSTDASHPTDGVWGYVAAADDAQLEITGTASATELIVDRVLAPGDSWIVVHLNDDGKPGMRVGLAHISAGESLEVPVPLEDVTGDSLIVAVHADKGVAGEFDFSMEDPTGSPDRPYFVDEKELALVVNVK